MRGLLADENVAGHVAYLRRRLQALGVWSLLAELHLSVATFSQVGLPQDLDDRSIWLFCQRERWVLFTDNRNGETADSLEATIRDLWRSGHLPVVTLGSKPKLERDPVYGDRVVLDLADLLFDLATGIEMPPRLYVPGRGRALA